MNELLDKFFLVFHSLLILFNLFGWIWRRTRIVNLVTLLLTGLSWFVAGIWYGMGYCPLTDWHWNVLKKLGQKKLPNSYIDYLIQRIFSIDLTDSLVDILTLSGFAIALAASVYTNFQLKKKKT